MKKMIDYAVAGRSLVIVVDIPSGNLVYCKPKQLIFHLQTRCHHQHRIGAVLEYIRLKYNFLLFSMLACLD